MGINNPKDNGGQRGTTGDNGGQQKQFPCTDFGPLRESNSLTKPPGPLKATLVWGGFLEISRGFQRFLEILVGINNPKEKGSAKHNF